MIQIVEVNTDLGLTTLEVVTCDQCEQQSTVYAASSWMNVDILRPIEARPAHFCSLGCAVVYFQNIVDTTTIDEEIN